MAEIVSPSETDPALKEIARLRRFTGPPAEFWPAFIAAASALAGAERGLLILKAPGDAKDHSWKKMSEWTQNGRADRTVLTFNQQLIEVGQKTAQTGSLLLEIEQSAIPELKHYIASVKLVLNRPEDICIAVFLLLSKTEKQAQEALVRLQLTADTPVSYLANSSTNQAKAEVEKFAVSIDTMTLLNSEKKFLGAALSFCNAVATRYHCDRVSLGWLEGGYIRLKTISRTERFDKNMAAVKALEFTMEECLDQDDEIIFPSPEGSTFVSRDHEKFASQNASGNIASIPIRMEKEAVAVLTCERQERPFTASELQQLRLTCDQAARRLEDLRQQDCWIGKRLAQAAQVQFAKALGPEKTWIKVFAILGAIALGILFFGHFRYRVEGNFILKSDAMAYLTAPFDGYIKEVNVRPGDSVKTGALLLQINTEDLLLEEASAQADKVRYERESEKARATNGLAEMRIASALADQSNARLDMARHRIQQAGIRATFNGVMVEGDLRERIGAPVKQGDALFKMTKLEGIYVEAEINQRDIHQIAVNTPAEIAFVSQPKLKYQAQVERIYPAASAKENENIFIVRCKLIDKPDLWWRPGMSGLVKIDAGHRTLFWILTHRTVDFLRLWLWW
ncbi:MAG: Membrane-fusion protein-like protein [Verrucomicrobiales bacterium]|nr:Membrane-fusion protein-like protein [Verrucomicrobiales bacterium]